MQTEPQFDEIKLVAYGMVIGFYLVLLPIGLYFYYRPPKNINALYGYRTPRSMKNQANWNFANRLGARYMLIAFHVFLAVSLLFLILVSPGVSIHVTFLFIIISLVVCLTAVIPVVESKLKQFERQQENGTSRHF